MGLFLFLQQLLPSPISLDVVIAFTWWATEKVLRFLSPSWVRRLGLPPFLFYLSVD